MFKIILKILFIYVVRIHIVAQPNSESSFSNTSWKENINLTDAVFDNYDGEYEEMEEDDYMPVGLKAYVQENFPQFTQEEEIFNERINQGQVAINGQFPFQAGLQIKRHGKRNYWCGGALISSEWILTAAHCVDKAAHIKVVLGAQDRKNSREFGRMDQAVNMENIVVHSSWDPESLANDIALIKLQPSIEYTNKIHPIVLPTREANYLSLANFKAWISGWGRYYKKCKKLSTTLRYALGEILSYEDCLESYEGRILESHICFNGTERQGVCRGDSGGPLFTRDENIPILIGIASFGRGCGNRAPGVFSRVTYYLDWIETATKVTITRIDSTSTDREMTIEGKY